MMNPDYCPVLALLLWFKLANITHSPIFPSMPSHHASLIIGTSMTPNTYSNWLRAAFAYVGGGLIGCTTHSIRKAAVSWATRCNMPESLIMQVGRWKERSTSFCRYIAHGVAIAAHHLNLLRKTTDPIYSFWVFETQVGGAV